MYGQYIVKGIFGDLLSDQINEKSRFFKVENTGEIVKNVTGYRTINMMFKQFKATGNEKINYNGNIWNGWGRQSIYNFEMRK